MNEGVEILNTMASIKSMLAANQQQYLLKISKSASYSTTQMLQANFKLRAANDAAMNQIMNECTRLGLQSITFALEQLRQNAEIVTNSLVTILQTRGSAKEKQSLKPLSNSHTAPKENAENLNTVNNAQVSSWILPPSQSNVVFGKVDPVQPSDSKSMAQQSKVNQINIETPLSDSAQPNLFGFSKNSGQNSHERAKKLYEDIERGKITWNWTSKIRDPFVLIELSQMISADLIKNIEKSKIDLSKVSDFGPAQSLRSNPSPITLLESIQSSIREFYNRIYKLDKPLNEKEFEEKQRQLEEELLSNIDERMREFWRHVIHTCMENYKLIWDNRLTHNVSVQTDVEELASKAEIDAVNHKHLAKLINMEVDYKKVIGTLNRLKDKHSKLKAEFKEKDELLKAAMAELSEAKFALATQRISSEESTSRSKYCNQKVEELQKKIDDGLIREKILIGDMANVQSVYNETLKFLSAMKEKLSDDFAVHRRSSVVNASYVLGVMDFMKKWDHIDFDNAIDTFVKYQKPNDQFKGNFIPQKMDMASFSLKMKEPNRDQNPNPPSGSFTSKRRISQTINILNAQNNRSLAQEQNKSKPELIETIASQNSKRLAKELSKSSRENSISSHILIFHHPTLHKSKLNAPFLKKGERVTTTQIKDQPLAQVSFNRQSSTDPQTDSSDLVQLNPNQAASNQIVSSQNISIVRKQLTHQTSKESQMTKEIIEEILAKQLPKTTLTMNLEHNQAMSLEKRQTKERNFASNSQSRLARDSKASKKQERSKTKQPKQYEIKKSTISKFNQQSNKTMQSFRHIPVRQFNPMSKLASSISLLQIQNSIRDFGSPNPMVEKVKTVNEVSVIQDDTSSNKGNSKDDEAIINFNENDLTLEEFKNTEHFQKPFSTNRVDFCYNFMYNKNVRAHTNPTTRRDKMNMRDTKITMMFPQINLKNQLNGLELPKNGRQVTSRSKEIAYQTNDGGFKIKGPNTEIFHAGLISDLTDKIVSRNIAALMARKRTSRFSSSKHPSFLDQAVTPNSPQFKTQQAYRPSRRSHRLHTDEQHIDPMDLRENNSSSPEKNLAVLSTSPKVKLSRKQTEKHFVPYTVSTDYFNNHILKKKIKGIKGISISRRKSVRPGL